MDNMGYSLSDLRAATENENGLGGNGILWLVVIFIILFGANGFGGFGNRSNGGENAVTESTLCNAMNFNDLENSVGRGFDQQSQFAMQQSRDLCQGFSAISSQIDQARFDNQQCCCAIERGIDSVNYNGAMNTNAIVQSQQAGTQRILDYLCGQENQRLRDENMRGYIHEQFCGVVRYPQATTWGAGPSPFFGGYGYGYNRSGNCGTGCCGTQF